MTLKVFISPNYSGIPEHVDRGGIRRVVEAQIKHLPKFGVEVVYNIAEADVINTHGTTLVEYGNTPIVNTSHGMYWSRQPWGDGFMEVNEQLVEAMHAAVAWTAPSNWVNTAMRRGMLIYPETIYHGVDGNEFLPSKTHGKYILWNKLRSDFVSDPGDMIVAAEHNPTYEFVSTIGSNAKGYQHPRNLKITGVLSHADMKKLVSEAGLYLSTVRETFGIGVLEAMAYGIPVVGFDWGGNSEIVKQGVTGYLATPGDYKMLSECIELAFAQRDALSENCIMDARENWSWDSRIEQYANIFKRVHAKYNAPERKKVSVVVTTYKLDKYLPACLDSVLRQTFSDFDCLVVDDAGLESTEKIVSDYVKRNPNIRYIQTPQNLGLPGARNFGCQNTDSAYIRHLDADDMLADNALELEITALDTDRSVDIVYGHLEVIRDDGSPIIENGNVVRSGWPSPQFNWYEQMAHMNQLPSCIMARREVYERSGGYRVRMKRQEDAEFWCRVTSLGFRAKKFTEAVTYLHRDRPDSKGAAEWKEHGAEPDWTAGFPWRMGASNFQQARDILRQRGEAPKNPHLVPFGAQGKPPQGLRFFYVHDFAYPVVSIVVTCGPGHRRFLIDALDSVQSQSFPDWECCVVNDTGEEWQKDILGAPWARVINMKGNQGVSAARNEGFKHTRGKFVVFLDADDILLPWFLEKMVGYAEYNDGVIFSDILLSDGEEFKINRYKDFDSIRVVDTMQYPGSSILVPRHIMDAVVELQGGFDTQIPGMEDWDCEIAIHHLGFCAFRIPEPLFVYRAYTSTKREKDYNQIDDIVRYINRKWSVYRNGEKQIMCGCSSTKKPLSTTPKSTLSSSGVFKQEFETVTDSGESPQANVEYLGIQQGTFSIKSRTDPRVMYRFGATDAHRVQSVLRGDVNFLISLGQYRVVGDIAAMEQQHDLASFVGQPIEM